MGIKGMLIRRFQAISSEYLHLSHKTIPSLLKKLHVVFNMKFLVKSTGTSNFQSKETITVHDHGYTSVVSTLFLHFVLLFPPLFLLTSMQPKIQPQSWSHLSASRFQFCSVAMQVLIWSLGTTSYLEMQQTVHSTCPVYKGFILAWLRILYSQRLIKPSVLFPCFGQAYV